MRKIKLRAWSLDDFKMVYDVGLTHDGVAYHPHGEADGDNYAYYDDCPLMQWTGLSDRYNRDIYEGDIIHAKAINTYFVVVWDAIMASFMMRKVVEGDIDPENFPIVGAIWKTVVGNRWENAELIQGAAVTA